MNFFDSGPNAPLFPFFRRGNRVTTIMPPRKKTGDARRRAAAWLALLVFALNVLAPVLVNGPVRAAVGVEGPLDGQVVICTPSGLRVVGADGELRPLADSGASGAGPSDSGDIQFCAFCLPLVNSGLGALAAAEIVLPAPAPRRIGPALPAEAATASATADRRLPEARAPPVSVT